MLQVGTVFVTFYETVVKVWLFRRVLLELPVSADRLEYKLTVVFMEDFCWRLETLVTAESCSCRDCSGRESDMNAEKDI